MPKSRGRTKRTGRAYAAPPPRKRRRRMPKWYGFVVLGLIGVGVVVIVWNYMRGDSASNVVLWVGLAIIASGFAAATQWT